MLKPPIQRREPLILLILGLSALLVSGIRPFDQFTWFLETVPAMIGAGVLVWTYRRFPLTPLLYRLIFLHALILMLGGHYTYARVPLGFTLRDWFGWERNPYDRIGHLAQGFVPAILARELVARRTPLKRGPWLWLFVIATCLGFSAFYEILEWWAAVFIGNESAVQFLGTQGDIWDTQWDMFLALLGSVASLILLSKHHQRELDALEAEGRGRRAGPAG